MIMKKLLFLFTIIGLTLTSCSNEGPVGPQGPPGMDGEDGLNGYLGTTFDVNVDLNNSTGYEALINFNDAGVEVYESDAVLVYHKVGEDGTTDDGQPVEIFEQLPQTYYVDGGEFQYNFDYTFYDVRLFIISNIDAATISADYTDNQDFRIIVVPADYLENSGVDVSDYNAVQSLIDMEDHDIIDVSPLQ
ncbi:MAG: hypothetical protein CME35_10385 [Gramella sp.]|nr:hypothetical protein [Christiangramia sp.]|tara:strand:+ start:559 stop:1128 length:570 start_codon:yes stop_codon:yes gene_type:complete